MVSEPNFVLDIKQTSLANKEDSHVHTAIRQAQAIRASPYQIGAQQAFVWWNQLDRPAPWHITTKTQEPDLQRQPHAPSRMDNDSWNSHTCYHRFLTPNLDLIHTCHQDGLVVHRSIWPENLVVDRCCTCLHAPPGFLTSHPRAGEHARSWHVLKTATNVIWHHRMTSSLHVSSHARTSTSALVHVNNTS